MKFVDTHCHIHFPDYGLDPEEAIAEAMQNGVTRLLCVGCTLPDSIAAIDLAERHSGIWAAIGLHPHEGARYIHDHQALQQFRELASHPKVVAIGETGLDYHYNHSPREDQRKLLRLHLDLALERKLPLIFHVREAYEDFWKIFDEYPKVRGVVHSFSAGQKELNQILERNLYVGLNGIMTFTKDPEQLAAAKQVPLQKLLIETDAPYLTPVPFRGTICQPKHVVETAKFLAELRHEPLKQLAEATTHNAVTLFKLE